MKTSAENTTERPPERPPNDPPNDPWFMSCQAQDPGPSLTTTWSAELPAPPHPFFIPKHQIKKTNVPPIQKMYVRGMIKGTFPPCKQGYDLANIRIWRPFVFRSQTYGWRNVHHGRGQLSESLLSYPPRQASSSKQQKAAASSSKQAATSVCTLERMNK